MGAPSAQGSATSAPAAAPPQAYADVLDLQGRPDAAEPPEFNDVSVFADLGAWHAYALPEDGDTSTYGGFTGPLYIAEEYPWWLSQQLSRSQ